MLLALEVLAAVVAILVGGLFALVLWARRGEGRPDQPNVRTVCRFDGASRYLTDAERAQEQEQGSIVLGEGILRALCAPLQSSGVSIEHLDADDIGWAMFAKLSGRVGYVRVCRTLEESDTWELTVQSRSSGGPGPTELLAPIDLALRSLDGIDRIAWYCREDTDRKTPHPAPLDRGS